MSASVRGGVDEPPAQVHVPVVVGPYLGDDVRRPPIADDGIIESDRLHTVPSSAAHKCRNDGCATHAHHSIVVAHSLRPFT